MSATVTSLPQLITLEEAVALYGEDKLSVPMLRAWCARGELPSTRAGKRLLISPADLAARLAPKLRPAATRPASRETPSQREARQLAESGCAQK